LILHIVVDNGVLGNYLIAFLIYEFSFFVFVLSYFFNHSKWMRELVSEFRDLEDDFQEEFSWDENLKI
jgi:hypothetical protein